MTTEPNLLDRDALHTTFDAWAAADESLDAQLSESLSALAAYESHLDAWQRQLAEERTELRQAREQLGRERAAAETNHGQSSAEVSAELGAVREKNAELTTSLLARTEELRTLDQRRAELAAELELIRAREKDLISALDEQKRLHEQERAQCGEELISLREMLEHLGETVQPAATGSAVPVPAQPTLGLPLAKAPTHRDRSNSGAVLGSIVEQFGKLRQQRAVDRQGLKKTR